MEVYFSPCSKILYIQPLKTLYVVVECIGAVKNNHESTSDVPYLTTSTPLVQENDNDAVGLNTDLDDNEEKSGGSISY